MRAVLKVILAIVVVLGATAAAIMLRPVESSQLIWPLVEAVALDDFVGVTKDGQVQTGLFEVAPTGVSTAPVIAAARDFLARLSDEQREQVMFEVDDDEWRRWANIHISTRQGVGFADMNASQQEAVWTLVAAGLSAKGYAMARDITRLEEHLADLKNDHYQYGEHRYWLTIMGEPASKEPWGWQFEGHHLIINFFVLGDQVVMTPTFMGSEPVIATSGKYQGTSVLQAEQALGLALINGLSEAQRNQAIIGPKTGNNNLGELFQDNAMVPAQGLPLAQLEGEPRRLSEQLIRAYVDNMRPGHAALWMQEILTHWQDTYLAWVGDTDDEAVFYYRIFSPVIMIEFDHQTPVALDGPKVPSRSHVHTVVRTPNGNDYGKDLLRQHLAEHPH